MAITWADVVVIAPELSGLAAGSQTYFLAAADRQIDDEQWLELADDGRRYLAAHLATIAGGASGGGGSAGAAGPITSESLGPMSRSYGTVAAGAGTGVDALLSTTRYGLYYLHLIRMLPSSVGFVP